MSILSDYNATGVTPSRVGTKVPYVDLDLRMIIHPKTHDVSVLTDIDAVKNAVKFLVLTNFYERPFQPFTGANVRGLLFENSSPLTLLMLETEIKRVIQDHETRVNAVSVTVVDQSDSYGYAITVRFNVISLNRQVDVSFFLHRIR